MKKTLSNKTWTSLGMAALLGWSRLLQCQAAPAALLGWNNLGMHCMDSSYAEFSILPPYNTIETHLIVGGKLVTNGTGYTITYEAVADPDGSINRSSVGKGNWADFAPAIFGLPPTYQADQGLAGWNMPGPANTPQSMLFENMPRQQNLWVRGGSGNLPRL